MTSQQATALPVLDISKMQGDPAERAAFLDELRRTAMERLEQGVRSIVLDLTNVTIVDGAALESLLWLGEQTARAGGSMRLVSPQHVVREALRLTRLAERFECAESVELAARSLR